MSNYQNAAKVDDIKTLLKFISFLEKSKLIQYLHDLNSVAEEFRDEQKRAHKEKEIEREWQVVSIVIDRLCFVVFGLASFVATATILSSSPYITF